MALEAFAATLPQAGRSVNQDAFLFRPGPVAPLLALADGAGAAQLAARRVLRHLDQLVGAAEPGAVEAFASWSGWFRVLDAAHVGGAQSTLIALSVLGGTRVVGAVAGDSRVYVWRRDGRLELLSEAADKKRIGSGAVTPFPLHARFGRGDILCLLTDGAWTPLSLTRLQSTIARSALQPLAQLPEAILREASRAGRGDDMTALVARSR